MDFHYDAFISYNHNPRDLMITDMLQRKLENFRIPADVKSKSGKTKIERVFLDRGELEVAGNLSDSILNALRNTDKLIVICSPGGHESPWVAKEIDLFLANGHTQDDILTVLTEGEPVDAIPERLLYKEVENEDGSITKEPAEPLSCDYRGDTKEANKTELPRLVAGIIGCRYDDLVQRQKHYRMKQMTRLFAALAAVMVLATTYFIWNAHRLKVAYENNMIEQSRSLAIQSDRSLDSGDRIQAINYALEALPSEEQPDRPVVPEAVGALVRAIDLYKSPDQQWIVSTREYKDNSGSGTANSDSVYSFDSRKYEDACIITAQYSNGNAAVWDADTGEQLLVDEIKKYREELAGYERLTPFLADDGKILLKATSVLYCVDIKTGEESWRYDLTDQGAVEVVGTKKDSVWVVVSMGNDRFLRRLDLANGKVTGEYAVQNNPFFVHLNDDGTEAVFCCYDTDKDHNVIGNDVFTVSAEDKEPTKVASFEYISDLGFTEDGDILVYSLAVAPTEDDETQFAWHDMNYGKRVIMADSGVRTALLMCYSKDGTQKWRTEVTDFFSHVPKTILKDGAEVRKGYIACTMGETLRYLDKSGKVVEEIDFGSPVIAYTLTDDGTLIQAVLLDGSFGSYNFEKKKLTVYSGIFHGIITDAMNTDYSFYVVSSGTGASNNKDRLLRYNFGGADTKWEDITCFDPESSIDRKDITAHDGQLCIVRSRTDYDADDDGRYLKDIVVIDIDEDKVVTSNTVTDSSNGETYFAGTDGKKMYFADVYIDFGSNYTDMKYVAAVLEVDTESGEGEMHYVEIPDDYNYNLHQDMMGAADGKVYLGADYTETYGDPLRLCLLTIDTDTWTAEFTAMEDETAAENGANAGEGTTAGTNAGEGATAGTEEENSVSFFTDKDPSCIDVSGKRVINTAGSKVIVRGFDGKVDAVLPDAGYKPVAVGVADSGELFMVERFTTGSVLHVYDSKLKEISTAEIGDIGEYTSYGVSSIRLTELPGGEKVIADNYNSVMLTEDYSSAITNIKGFRTFDSKTGKIIIMQNGEKYGTVPYRTLDEMIAEGRAAAGDN